MKKGTTEIPLIVYHPTKEDLSHPVTFVVKWMRHSNPFDPSDLEEHSSLIDFLIKDRPKWLTDALIMVAFDSINAWDFIDTSKHAA